MKKIMILLKAEVKQFENSGGPTKLLLIARLSLIETATFISNMIYRCAIKNYFECGTFQ